MSSVAWRVVAAIIFVWQLYQFQDATDHLEWKILAIKLPLASAFLFSAIGMGLYAFDVTIGNPRLWAITKYLLFAATAVVILAGLLLRDYSTGTNLFVVSLFLIIAVVNGVALDRLARRTQMRRF